MREFYRRHEAERRKELYPGVNDLLGEVLQTENSHLMFWYRSKQLPENQDQNYTDAWLFPDLLLKWEKKSKQLKLPTVCTGKDRIQALAKMMPSVCDKFAGAVIIDRNADALFKAKRIVPSQLLTEFCQLHLINERPHGLQQGVDHISSLDMIGVIPDGSLKMPDGLSEKLRDGVLYVVGVNHITCPQYFM